MASVFLARDRDVEEPPLLVAVLRVRTGVFAPPLARERLLAHAENIDVLCRYPLRVPQRRDLLGSPVAKGSLVAIWCRRQSTTARKRSTV
jgi:hypothetical protein